MWGQLGNPQFHIGVKSVNGCLTLLAKLAKSPFGWFASSDFNAGGVMNETVATFGLSVDLLFRYYWVITRFLGYDGVLKQVNSLKCYIF